MIVYRPMTANSAAFLQIISKMLPAATKTNTLLSSFHFSTPNISRTAIPLSRYFWLLLFPSAFLTWILFRNFSDLTKCAYSQMILQYNLYYTLNKVCILTPCTRGLFREACAKQQLATISAELSQHLTGTLIFTAVNQCKFGIQSGKIVFLRTPADLIFLHILGIKYFLASIRLIQTNVTLRLAELS